MSLSPSRRYLIEDSSVPSHRAVRRRSQLDVVRCRATLPDGSRSTAPKGLHSTPLAVGC